MIVCGVWGDLGIYAHFWEKWHLFQVWRCLINQGTISYEVITVIVYRIKSHMEEFLRQENYNLIGNSLGSAECDTQGPKGSSAVIQTQCLQNWSSKVLGSNSSNASDLQVPWEVLALPILDSSSVKKEGMIFSNISSRANIPDTNKFSSPSW